MKTNKFVALLLALVLAMGFGANQALADSALIDFEAYTTGTVHGQDGWSSSGAAGSGCAIYDHQIVDASLYGYSTFGTRSLRMSNAVTSGCFGDQTFSKSLVDEAGETSAASDGLSGGTRQTYFEAEWDFASTVPGSEQSGLSVVASPDRGDGARMSWVQMADTPAGLEVNFYDYQEAASPPVCDDNDFVFTNLVSGLDRTVPHTIKIQMYFVDGAANDVVRVWVDGILEHTGTSWEDYFRNCEGNPTRPVDSILFRTGGTAAPATAGNGFLIDNLELFSGPVPQCTSVCYVDGTNGNDAFGGNAGDPKKTIQAAIDQVDPGGTVIVLPGTYNESPNITKSLTLQSSGGRDVTTIQLQSGPTYLGSLTINGADVTVDGFTIVGFDGTASTLASTNIYVTSVPDNVEIINNRLKVGEINSLSSNGDDGMGLITTYNTSADVETVTVRNNIIEPLNAAGTRAFYVNPGVNHFTFANNEISGKFLRTAITQAKDGIIEENTVTGAGPAGSRSAGMGTWGYPDPAVYGHTTFRNNTISGTFKGVAIFETEGVTVENNTFSSNDYGVWIGPAVPLAFDLSTIHINGNSITDNHFNGVEKDASLAGTVDASANWWGTNTSSGVAAEVSAGVDYTPWLNAGTDTNGAPGFQGDFSYLHVDDDSPQTGTTGRIQEGIDRVTASTVHVIAGTYFEQLSITDSMTIFGDGAATTFIQAPATPLTGDKAIVKIGGAGVSVDISAFTITGPGSAGCDSIRYGILVRDGASADIHDNHILDIRDNPFSGCQNGVGIFVGRKSLSTTGTATISNNVIAGYQKGGIVVDNAGSSATITGNVITGVGPTASIAQNGIQISRGATGSVSGNTVSGNQCNHASCGPDPITGVQSAGILLFDPGAGTLISGNSINDNDMGVYNFVDTGSAPTVDSNILMNNRYEGIYLDQGNATISNNELSGVSNIGVAVVSFNGSTANSTGTLTNNKITGAGTGIRLIDETTADSFIPTVTANLNSITGNTVGLDNTTGSIIDAEKNWWGDASGPTHASNPTGTGEVVSNGVDFSPWLCEGTDTSPDTGFQPNVSMLCSNPAPAACLAYGVQDAGVIDSQFFTLDPDTAATANLGPLYPGMDFEALDIDPFTGVIYATTGNGNAFGQKGHVFKVDGADGSLFHVGPTGQREIEALSFRPTDGVLWGWGAGKGLVTINTSTGAATLVKANSKDIEGMAWNNDGTLLYMAAKKVLFAYNPANGKITTVARNLPGNVEAMDMRPDGLLALGVSGKTTLYLYNPVTKAVVSTVPGLPYNDIEGIAWPWCSPE